MHQPFIHMMQRSGDRNSCGYAGGPQPLSFYISDLDKRQLSDAGRLGCCSPVCGKNVRTV
jgi:hypothetical protein